jgi:GTP-binding protein Era
MARQASANVQILVVVVDASRPPQLEDEGWFRRALFAGQPVFFLLNKCDRGPTPHVPAFHAAWKAIQDEKGHHRDDVVWMEISAATRRNLPQLLEALFARAEPGEPYFPDDTVTDYPRPLAIADVIREKLFRHLSQELPHEIGVRIDDIREDGRRWHVRATILVNRPSQKPIVLGERGRVIRSVRRAAEPEISAMFDVDADLELWVKVEKNWAKNFWLLRQMGYDAPR